MTYLTVAQRRILLKEYRDKHRRLAVERDDGKCQVCRYKEQREVAGNAVHHVYGRGKWKTREEREHYSKLLTVCLRHHDHDGGELCKEFGKGLKAYYQEVLEFAVSNPLRKVEER